MLKIQNLHAEVEDKSILKGLNLEVKAGEVHAIMGPNGAGKSTMASVIAGKEEYEVTSGSIELEGEDIGELDPEERAHAGVFLSFQYQCKILKNVLCTDSSKNGMYAIFVICVVSCSPKILICQLKKVYFQMV